MSAADPHETVVYRLAPLVTARFVGLYLVALAVVVFVATGVVFAADWPADLLVALVLVGLVGLAVMGWWLRRRAFLLQAAPDGYTVRMVRGAGVKAARWTEVEDAVTTTIHDEPCVVLRLKDGRTTTIPVSVLAVDKEQFVRELQQHLQRGHRLR
jgi:apolipoprotein N-acyltransferase